MTQPTKEPVHWDVRNGCKWKYIRKVSQNSGGQDPPKMVEKHSSNKICGENSDGKITAVKLPFISFQRKGLTPETRDKTSRQTFHKKFTASHFTKPEFFRWSFWAPFFVSGVKYATGEEMVDTIFPNVQSISPGHHHCLCRDVCDWHIPGCHSNPLQQTPNKKAQKMIDAIDRKPQKKHTKPRPVGLLLELLSFKESNAKPSTFRPCIQEWLFQVKFSNCKHASYPKVHTWHHILRNRVVVPFQVDLPPASEIDKSWKLWIERWIVFPIFLYIYTYISYGFVVHLEGNWIWKGIDFVKSCSANKKTAHGVTTLRSCWDCHVGSSHAASTLPPIEITSLQKKKEEREPKTQDVYIILFLPNPLVKSSWNICIEKKTSKRS